MPVQYIVKHRLLVIAVGRDLVFLSVLNLHTCFFHQLPGLIAAGRITQYVQSLLHPPATVAVITRLGYISHRSSSS